MILDIDSIETYYGETQALFGVSLNVEEGREGTIVGDDHGWA